MTVERHASPKVRRLLAEKRVQPAGGASVFVVQGDRDSYRVVLGYDWAVCSCPALREECSHVVASRLLCDALAEERAARHLAKAAS